MPSPTHTITRGYLYPYPYLYLGYGYIMGTGPGWSKNTHGLPMSHTSPMSCLGVSLKSALLLPGQVQCSSFQGPKPYKARCGHIFLSLIRLGVVIFAQAHSWKEQAHTQPGCEAMDIHIVSLSNKIILAKQLSFTPYFNDLFSKGKSSKNQSI